MKYYRVPAILELTGVGVAGMAGMRDPPPLLDCVSELFVTK